MILSRDRILTTHVGSLPRSETLSELLVQREAGESYDKAQLRSRDGQGGAPRRLKAERSGHRQRQ